MWGRERRWNRGRWRIVKEEDDSQSVSPQLLEARFQQSCKRGLRPKVGTDLCDTHATRRITHSLAHNILPSPYFPLAKPLTPLPAVPVRSIASNQDKRQTNAPILRTASTIFITYRDYVFQRFSSSCMLHERHCMKYKFKFINESLQDGQKQFFTICYNPV